MIESKLGSELQKIRIQREASLHRYPYFRCSEKRDDENRATARSRAWRSLSCLEKLEFSTCGSLYWPAQVSRPVGDPDGRVLCLQPPRTPWRFHIFSHAASDEALSHFGLNGTVWITHRRVVRIIARCWTEWVALIISPTVSALRRNHALTLYVRTPSKLPEKIVSDQRVTVVQGELHDEEKLKSCFTREGAKPIDAVISTLGPKVGQPKSV